MKITHNQMISIIAKHSMGKFQLTAIEFDKYGVRWQYGVIGVASIGLSEYLEMTEEYFTHMVIKAIAEITPPADVPAEKVV